MMRGSLLLASGLILSTGVSGFAALGTKKAQVSLSASKQEEVDSRRTFFAKTATIASVGLGFPFIPSNVANAVTGTSKVNAKLQG